MKYIDAEKLKALLEQRKKQLAQWTDREYANQRIDEIDCILDVDIVSLQQEQPDFPITNEQIKEFLATHPKIKVPEKYKNPDWLFNEQEQPDVDLVKAARHVYESWMGGTMDDVRRDMVELGRVLDAKKEE